MRVPPVSFGSLPVKTTYTKQYNQFLGVDFSTDPAKVDGSRSPNAVNLISDAGGYPEKRTGWEVLKHLPGQRINGLFHFVDGSGKAHLLAHCGASLYGWTDFPNGQREDLAINTMADTRSTAFDYAGKLYMLDGQTYRMYDGVTLAPVEGDHAYTPTTVVGRAPGGGGTPLEAVNLLSARRKNSFVGFGGTQEVVRLQIYNKATAGGDITIKLHDAATTVTVAPADTTTGIATKIMNKKAAGGFAGWTPVQVGDCVTFTKDQVGTNAAADFAAGSTGVLAGLVTLTPGADAATTLQLDAANLDAAAVTMAVNGGEPAAVAEQHIDRIAGVIKVPGGTPEGNGVDNIVVEFSKTADTASPIKRCTIATWFGQGNDSRVFVSGNPDHKNWDWQSGLYDPTYFPDTGYTKIGADSSGVMGYLKQYSTLLILKEDNEQDATIFQRTAELDANGNPFFPLKQGVAGIGAISRYAFGTLRDDPLFLAKEGVFATSTAYGGVDQQKITQGRSYLVNAKLVKETGLPEAVATVWRGLYILCVNGHCYVADGRKKTGKRENEGFGYEWFYWTNISARCFLTIGDLLYFGDGLGRICRFRSYTQANDRFSDDGAPIVALWASKLDDDGDFMIYKTMPQKGSGILVKPYSKSSIDVYMRTDALADFLARETEMSVFDWGAVDFEHFSFVTNDAPYIVPINSRVKRYKSIQIILRNDEADQGFGCFGVIRRYNIGNYVR